jgi:hypothetical protein
MTGIQSTYRPKNMDDDCSGLSQERKQDKAIRRWLPAGRAPCSSPELGLLLQHSSLAVLRLNHGTTHNLLNVTSLANVEQ